MIDERVRLFVALELPADVREALVRWRTDALTSLPALREPGALRMTAPEALHVTLCFLGWQDRAVVPEIERACAALASMPAASLHIGGVLWLPPRRARVLAAELLDPERSLVAAQATLSLELAAGGWYRLESRPFLPHVTVARAGTRTTSGRGVRVADPPSAQFTADTVTLYRSQLHPSGARYEALCSFRLAGRAAA